MAAAAVDGHILLFAQQKKLLGIYKKNFFKKNERKNRENERMGREGVARRRTIVPGGRRMYKNGTGTGMSVRESVYYY